MDNACPSCGSTRLKPFYELSQVPVHSVLLMHSRQEAAGYPKGDIRLHHCTNCGFICNLAFDSSDHEYSSRYEETQGFSPTFSDFQLTLATELVERYGLHGKDIMDIGCGKGDFLTLLCELGGNRGVGFDPSYVSGRTEGSPDDQVTFIKDFYTDQYANYTADFVCCKMTLEHIQRTGEFIRLIRNAVEGRPNSLVFFQVPDVARILKEMAFWDIYYEHCSYFSAGSLARLFRQNGYGIIDLKRDYEDQYLMLVASGSGKAGESFPDLEDDLVKLEEAVSQFSKHYVENQGEWRTFVRSNQREGRKIVLWGSGSKGVAFLTTLGIRDEVEYVVDINPRKHGTFMAGTGQEIVSPEFLQEYEPDIVVIMNPAYKGEIRSALDGLGLAPQVVAV